MIAFRAQRKRYRTLFQVWIWLITRVIIELYLTSTHVYVKDLRELYTLYYLFLLHSKIEYVVIKQRNYLQSRQLISVPNG